MSPQYSAPRRKGETGHAHGHLEYLEAVGDPATGLPIGTTSDNLKAAIAGETHEYTDMYPGMARKARDEGFEEISDWFETLAKAERSHANRFQKALDAMPDAAPPQIVGKAACGRALRVAAGRPFAPLRPARQRAKFAGPPCGEPSGCPRTRRFKLDGALG